MNISGIINTIRWVINNAAQLRELIGVINEMEANPDAQALLTEIETLTNTNTTA